MDAGIVVSVHSDWAVTPLNPFPKIQYLMTRKHPDLPDMEPFVPENAITVAEALRAYTWNAAYAIDRKQETGSIEVGKFADMIVLDRNLLKIGPREIAGTKVKKTIFAGEDVYERH